jgi:protein-tyrosine phosphatase
MSVSYNWVTERIAVGGGISSVDDISQLVANGVTHIIDMRAEYDDNVLADSRVTVLWLPQLDDGSPRPSGQYRTGIRFAFEALTRAGTKVFPHCAAGHDRGPTMCYALLRALGISKDEAIGRIRTARPEVTFFQIQTYLDSVEHQLLIP